MFCALIRISRKVNGWVVRAAKAIARRVTAAWRRHLDHVAGNPGYTTATAAVVAAALGLMSKNEVVGAIVAGLLGVFLRDVREAGSAIRYETAKQNYDMY